MKILVLSPTLPVPANNGSRIRIHNFIRRLSERHDVTLLAQSEHMELSREEKALLEKLCAKVIIGPAGGGKLSTILRWIFSGLPYRHVKTYRRDFGDLVRAEVENGGYDVIFCNFLDMAQYLRGPTAAGRNALFVIDQHNWDESWFRAFRERGSFPLKVFGYINIKRLKKCQGEYYSLFDLCLSVSEEDKRDTEASLHDPPRIIVARNGVDLEYFRPAGTAKKGNMVLFCGSMDVKMNQSAVLYFYRDIFPLIKRRCGECHFLVVGRSPPPVIKRLSSSPDVTVTGTVDDVRPYYDEAKVLVAPFLFGGGTKLKIAEAMAMKVPVVSTSVGCQGMEVENGRHIIISDDPAVFAENVVDVMNSPPGELVDSAYQLVRECYSWDAIVSQVEKTMHDMLQKKRVA